MRRSLKACEAAMKNAPDYATWHEAAHEYDRVAGLDDWREDDASPHYDYDLLRRRMSELKTARQKNDVNQLVFYLHEGLHGNLGNIANSQLYCKAKAGTKRLITEYLDEVTTCLRYICDNDFDTFPLTKKLDFFERTSLAFGRSALMLSGGAALGLFHLGVIKAIWNERLLPNVMSGSSAGSIMVAVMGTHTDEELEQIFDPEYLYVEAFRTVGWRGFIRGRPLMDGEQLEIALERNVKDMTFEEAYKMTGRQINITVSPSDPHQEARLLNPLTAPNVLIQKASLASCAIPGVFPPVMLWAKNIHGEKVPYIPSRQWVDGSIKNDLPISRMSRLYSVNHTIVSQTNPHVVPFLSRNDGRNGLPAFVRSMVSSNLRLNTQMLLDVARNKVKSNGLGLMLDKAHSVVSQRYMGDINLVPPRRPSNIMRVVQNATPNDVADYVRLGELATWPRIEMIRNTTKVSRCFEECMKQLKEQEVRQLLPVKLVSNRMA